MGLDWKPLNKPLAGYEDEYRRLFMQLSGAEKPKMSILDKLLGKQHPSRESLLDRFLEISSTAYETLNAPQVGIDSKATEWAASKFQYRQDQSLTLDQFMTQMHGYYVVELVPECDGIPVYIAGHDEAHIFRAQFLVDCEEILGQDIFESAYQSKLAKETREYADELMTIAERYAAQHDCSYLKDRRTPPEGDMHTPQAKAHILFSAAKWLRYWSDRGHGMEADF